MRGKLLIRERLLFNSTSHSWKMMNFIFKTGNERKEEPRVISDLSEKFINATNKNINMYLNTYTDMYLNKYTMLHTSTTYIHFN